MTVVLALECSQRSGGVAIQRATGAVRVARLESASGVDDQLVPTIARLFGEISASPQELSWIGVSIGPGGFTGLRVAIATAKTLSRVTGCHIAAIPTARVAAVSLGGPPRTTGVLLAERRGTAWFTCVSPDGDVLGDPGLVDPASLLRRVEGCDVLVGDAHVQQTFGDGIRASGLPIEDLHVNPAACLELTVAEAKGGSGT